MSATLDAALAAKAAGIPIHVLDPLSVSMGLGMRVIAAARATAAVLHCDAPAGAQGLVEQVAARFRCAELLTVEAGPVIGRQVRVR